MAFSPAVLAAKKRRAEHEVRDNVRFEWFIKSVSEDIALTVKQRVALATEIVKDKIVRNISTAVFKSISITGKVVVTVRSMPGEFPRADTTLLMKTMFADTKQRGQLYDGFVGTPLDYGLILETQMNRSFMVRTLNEMRGVITKVLTGPIA